MQDRDFDLRPYDSSEAKIAEYINQATGGKLGGGDDPVEFLISLHASLTLERRAIIAAARLMAEEPIYYPGLGINNISDRFLMRLTLLLHALGLIAPGDLAGQALVKEATAFFVKEAKRAN